MNIAVEQLAAKSTRLATPAYAATGLLAQAARMLHAAPGSPAYLAMVEEHATRKKQMSVFGWSGQCALKTRMRRVLNGQCSNGTCACNKGYRGRPVTSVSARAKAELHAPGMAM